MSKVLETIVLERIKQHEEQNQILIPEQFGFKKHHCTVKQLARITDKITNNFNIKKTTSLLTLDIEKAFDSVWHQGLIYKLINLNFPPYIIKIIHSFLTNRTFQVKVNGKLSDKQKIPAGTPQGAVTSPTLFNYFINDIPKHPQTSLALFADDTAIIAESRRTNQCNL